MSRADVARLADVPVGEVYEATAVEVEHAYADSAPEVVVEVVTAEDSVFWRVGSRFYLDSPEFGPVVAIDDLRYNSDLGLHHKDIGE